MAVLPKFIWSAESTELRVQTGAVIGHLENHVSSRSTCVFWQQDQFCRLPTAGTPMDDSKNENGIHSQVEQSSQEHG
ncbi:MAG: hypothetical protein AB3N14_01555 [Flavobacteriaceae bacterium]